MGRQLPSDTRGTVDSVQKLNGGGVRRMIMIFPTSQVPIQVPSDFFRDPKTSRVRQLRARLWSICHEIGVLEWPLSVNMSILPATRRRHSTNGTISHNITLQYPWTSIYKYLVNTEERTK